MEVQLRRVLTVDELSQPPSLDHPMGTDAIGHDLFAQVLRGAQKSVQIALLVALVSTTIGMLIGAFAGLLPRDQVDSALMRVHRPVPRHPAARSSSRCWPRKFAGVGIGWRSSLCLAALSWTSIARVVRGVFLSLREKEFVEAARALGASNKRIIFQHLLPNAVGPIIVNATITVAVAILIETSLSFLGLGVQAPDTSLGKLISEQPAGGHHPAVALLLPGPVHHPDRPVRELPRRRPARCLRPDQQTGCSALMRRRRCSRSATCTSTSRPTTASSTPSAA